MAFEMNPDGSTKRIFVQISDFHGFAIVDFAQRKEVGRVTLPDDIPAEKVDKGPFNALAVARPRRRARRQDACG